MKNQIFVGSVLLASIAISACNSTTKTSTILLEGTAKEMVMPNNAKLHITIECINKSYAKSGDELKQKAQLLKNELAKFNIDGKELKTLNFSIVKHSEYNSKTGTYEEKGYRGVHTFELVLNQHYDKLGAVIDVLYNSSVHANLDIYHTVQDSTLARVKDQLLQKSLADAKAKATSIANGAEVKLDKIEKIRYGNTLQYSDLENGVMVGNFSGAGLMYKTEMAVSGENADMTSTIEINPKAIEISESVVVSWEIK